MEIRTKRGAALIGALGLLLSAGSCNLANITAGSTTVSAQAAYIAINTFNGLKSGVTAYDELPLCGAAGASVVCHKMAAVKALDAAVRTGTTPRNMLQAALDSACGLPLAEGATPSSAACPTVPISAYNALSTTIATLRSAYVNYGVAVPANAS